MPSETVVIDTRAIPTAKLAAMPDDARALVFMLGHIANELTTLDRLMQFASNFDEPTDAVGRIHLSQSLFLGRILAGKEVEAWDFIRKTMFAREARTYIELVEQNQDAKGALEQLKKYFGRKNLVSDIRNNFAFHYSTDDWPRRLTNIFAKIEEGDCEFYVSERRLNTHWWGAEVILNYAMLDAIQTDDPVEANRRLSEEAGKVFDWLYSVCDYAIPAILHHYGALGETKDSVSIPDPPSRRQVRLPVVLSTRSA